MTPEQIKLVQESFTKVAPIANEAADVFYNRLFSIAPEVRPLFPRELSAQKKKLMQMLTVAVTNFTSSTRSFPSSKSSAAATLAMGWRLTTTSRRAPRCCGLEHGLGSTFTPQVRDAWAATYATVADVMKGAARRAQSPLEYP